MTSCKANQSLTVGRRSSSKMDDNHGALLREHHKHDQKHQHYDQKHQHYDQKHQHYDQKHEEFDTKHAEHDQVRLSLLPRHTLLFQRLADETRSQMGLVAWCRPVLVPRSRRHGSCAHTLRGMPCTI